MNGDQINWDQTYEFFYPKNGMTYRAHAVGTELVMGESHQKGVGARTLEWANWLATYAYLVNRDVGGMPIFSAAWWLSRGSGTTARRSWQSLTTPA